MSPIEIEAKTTQEAIEKACQYFNLREHELDIEILENRSTGIFGIIGNKKAKIKATPKKDASVEFARETLTKILSLISPDTEVTAEKKEDDIYLNIKGNDPGILIGPKGKTLEAIEYIMNKAVNKVSEKKARVVVDSENYRKRKDENLKRLALTMGEKAKKTNKTVITDLISPHDRRIIHLTLKGDHQVQTTSKGEGVFKKVFIMPNKNKVDEKQND